jgi:hypothetical protein
MPETLEALNARLRRYRDMRAIAATLDAEITLAIDRMIAEAERQLALTVSSVVTPVRLR